MRSMQWQLGILGTISAFAFRHRETEKNLCRDGWLTCFKYCGRGLPTAFFPNIAPSRMFTANSLCLTVCPIHEWGLFFKIFESYLSSFVLRKTSSFVILSAHLLQELFKKKKTYFFIVLPEQIKHCLSCTVTTAGVWSRTRVPALCAGAESCGGRDADGADGGQHPTHLLGQTAFSSETVLQVINWGFLVALCVCGLLQSVGTHVGIMVFVGTV